MKRAFIYALVDPTKEFPDSIRYVGVTTTSLARRMTLHLSEAKTSKGDYYRLRWLRSLFRNGIKPTILLLEETTEDLCFDIEKRWISKCKQLGCRLTNSTEGGEGILNPTPETRMKISQKSRNRSQETKRKLSEAMKGKKLSYEIREKIREKHKGKVTYYPTDSTKQKISEKLMGNKNSLGHRHSESTKAVLSVKKMGNKGRFGVPHTQSTKEKLRIAHSGDKSNSAKLTWEDVRNIREKYASGKFTQQELAEEYGIALESVS
jgi:hypothetical protein